MRLLSMRNFRECNTLPTAISDLIYGYIPADKIDLNKHEKDLYSENADIFFRIYKGETQPHRPLLTNGMHVARYNYLYYRDYNFFACARNRGYYYHVMKGYHEDKDSFFYKHKLF